MFNEDFNEIADQLAKEVSTSRRERTFYGGLITEIRELWKALEVLGYTPQDRCEECTSDCESGCENEKEQGEVEKKTTKKATKKTTKKATSKS